MNVVAVVQARLSSTRLPRKVLQGIDGQPMLFHVVKRLRTARRVDQVVVATSDQPDDDELVEWCDSHDIPCVRGPLNDVLYRFVLALNQFNADVAVRVTSDCPLADPELVDEVVCAFFERGADYAANRLVEARAYPIGLDVEVFSSEALRRAERDATEDFEREHVTPYLYAGDHGFDVEFVGTPHECAQQRWTVDTPEDLEFVRAVFARLHGSTRWTDVLSVIEDSPELLKIHEAVSQKSLFTSQKQDQTDV